MSGVWYKRNPSDFLYGVRKLNAETRGVYATLLEMFYEEGGMIAGDNPAYLAGQCGCSTRKFNTILSGLQNSGKVIEHEGYLTNRRVLSQLNPEFMSRLCRDKREIILSKCKKNKDLRWGKNTQEAQETPNPLQGDLDFEVFWEGYPPKARQDRKRAQRAWGDLTAAQRQAAITALPMHAQEMKKRGKVGPTPATYLRGGWWDKYAQEKIGNIPTEGTDARRLYDALTKSHSPQAYENFFSGSEISGGLVTIADSTKFERAQRYRDAITQAGFKMELAA